MNEIDVKFQNITWISFFFVGFGVGFCGGFFFLVFSLKYFFPWIFRLGVELKQASSLWEDDFCLPLFFFFCRAISRNIDKLNTVLAYQQ